MLFTEHPSHVQGHVCPQRRPCCLRSGAASLQGADSSCTSLVLFVLAEPLLEESWVALAASSTRELLHKGAAGNGLFFE